MNTITRTKQIWFATLIAVAVVAAAAASPAHAEIIDFDPAVDDVPAILQPDEIDLLDQAASSEFLSLLAVPSPSGEYLFAARGDARGAIDVATGFFMDLPVETVGEPYLSATWRPPSTLLQLYAYLHEPGDAPPEIQYYMLEWDMAVGLANFYPYDVSSLGGEIISAGPGYDTFLVIELPEQAPGPVTVDLGPVYGPERDRIPDGAPGVVGRHPFGPMALQQAEFTLALVAGDTRHEMATYPLDTGIAGATWSDDGSRVSVVTRTMPGWREARPRRDEPIWPGTPNLGSVPVQEALGNIPPAENPLVTGTRILVAEVATGDTLKTIHNTEFPQGTLIELAFSPTNQRALLVVATRSHVEGRTHPTYSFPNGAEFHLLDDELNVVKQLQAPGLELLAGTGAFAGDNNLLYAFADEVDHVLRFYDLETDDVKTVPGVPPGAVYQMVLQAPWAYFTHAGADAPVELWRSGGEEPGSYPEPVTDLNAGAAALAAELVAEDVSWQASDGETLHGYYVHHVSQEFPPAVPGPLVVWQQGGPGGQMLRDYGDTVEAPYGMLPHFGLPVLVANAAGRNVKSTDFYTDLADKRDFGQIDVAQIKEGVDHLVAEGIVHPGRVGVTGCSYGGYFTLQSMRTYPDFYAAGNPQCALTDLFEEFTFGYTPMMSFLMGASPMAEADEYLQDSPYHGVKDVSAPVLIFHGTEDFLPVQLLNNIHDELDANEVDTTFLRVLGEEHGFSGAASQDYARQLQVQFFTRTLIETDPPLPPRGGKVFMPIALRGELP